MAHDRKEECEIDTFATNKVIQARWKIEFMASRTVEVYGTITESTVNVFLHILYL